MMLMVALLPGAAPTPYPVPDSGAKQLPASAQAAEVTVERRT
ncbi:MAG: hypothetical protein WCB27_21150 [Thermoguttaceae bacterium]